MSAAHDEDPRATATEHDALPATVLGDLPTRLVDRLRFLESAFGSSQNAIIITDCQRADNPVVAANPAFTRVTGYAPDEIIGRNCRFLQRDDRDQPEIDVLRSAIVGGHEAFVTLRNYRRDGTMFWNELRIAPIRDARGAVTHFLGIQNDVSERVLAEQALVRRTADLERARDQLQDQAIELADATQARDRFMATVSHEMRTPINAVLGYADLLDLEIPGSLTDAQRDYVARIQRTGRGLLDLVNDVLDLTRAEFGHLDVELASVDPLPVIEEVAALVEGQAQQKGLVLSLVAPDGAVPPVRADRRRVRQVLLNLLANAVKFTETGTVTLRISTVGPRVEFSVGDTGIGISPEQLPFVFEEFYQADRNLTRRYGGAGLGLAISRRLAQLMGGELTARSELRRGSTFTLTLLRADDGGGDGSDGSDRAASVVDGSAQAGSDGRHPADGERPPRTPIRVVVFGPDDSVLGELGRTLYPDIQILVARTSDDVRGLAHREHAALIVLDVNANGGAGWQVAHTLREDSTLDHVPILILPTSAGGAGRVASALDLGVVAFAGKMREPPTDEAARLTRAVERAATDAAARRGESNSPTAGAAIDVLVVDDDADARRITMQVLQNAGASVREATDGESGLAAMRTRRPDVAVIDLLMPVLDGFGVLAAMRADARLRSVPVVVLTTKALTAAERDYLARTAERVLEKGEYRLSDVATLILRAATRR